MTESNSKLAFVFPGQGSQSVGMLGGLAEAYPSVLATFSEASEQLGYDLWQLCADGPADALNKTDRTQPAMLAAGVAAWRVWLERGGPRPAFMAGHSLGEFTALVCAGSLEFGAAVALVAERGRLMQEAVPAGQGGMAAILGLEDEQVAAICESQAQGEVLAPVNFNSPGQVVIAGAAAAVERGMAAAKEAGAKRALALAVSAPSHCALMKPAADAFAERLAAIEVKAPTIPVLHNVDVSAHDDADQIRSVLALQLYNPVRWTQTVRELGARGITTLVEAGPGKVLAGLTKRIDKSIGALPLFDAASLDKALDAMDD